MSPCRIVFLTLLYLHFFA
uniref:Uncharacterized protein n=1 Tax=Anguilla anguilla TaxID=7936 RepID=A0A0E9TFT0_ANGAN